MASRRRRMAPRTRFKKPLNGSSASAMVSCGVSRCVHARGEVLREGGLAFVQGRGESGGYVASVRLHRLLWSSAAPKTGWAAGLCSRFQVVTDGGGSALSLALALAHCLNGRAGPGLAWPGRSERRDGCPLANGLSLAPTPACPACQVQVG